MDNQPILGLRTALYRVTDLDKAKEWYRAVLGIDPYFDEPFYVGFNVGGFELGLDPDDLRRRPARAASASTGESRTPTPALARLLELGGREHAAVTDVGGGIRVAAVLDPFGNVFGIIENPHFKLEGPGAAEPVISSPRQAICCSPREPRAEPRPDGARADMANFSDAASKTASARGRHRGPGPLVSQPPSAGRPQTAGHFLGDFPTFKWEQIRDHLPSRPARLDGARHRLQRRLLLLRAGAPRGHGSPVST